MTNDYELEMISKATQRTRAELRALTGGVITTLGEQGSVIDNGERGSVGIAAPKTVADHRRGRFVPLRLTTMGPPARP